MGNDGKYDSPWKATFKGITDLYSKKQNLLNLPDDIDLIGKRILITGSSSGLGYAAALKMAKADAEVIMAVRSGIPEKGAAIKKLAGNDQVKMYYVDLSDLKSISQLLDNLVNDEIKIDILISNAAMVPLNSRKTPQGLEEMFVVNYLAPFYLINKIIDKKVLTEKDSKIIIVSSESHRNPKTFDWDGFGQYHDYGISETVSRYGYFKLLLTTFGNELSRRLNSDHLRTPVRMLCPGPVNSNIAREAPKWMQPILKAVFSLFFRSPEKASDPILYFVSETDKDPVSYLFLMQPEAMDDRAIDEANGKKLWEMSEGLLGSLGFPI